jgi:protein-tyrosine-phosphatase
MLSDLPLNILFPCNGNSARSILAEALMNRMGRGRSRAYSAGSMPKVQVNPHALPLDTPDHVSLRRELSSIGTSAGDEKV